MKQIQYSQKTMGKSIPAYGFQNSRKKIRKQNVTRLLPSFCDFRKEYHTLGYGLKNL
jgi:hypothetical protein